jgi:transcriptional regulator with XRE-family HTH domain
MKKRLVSARKYAGLSMRALALKMEVSHTTIYDYEKGNKKPDSTYLIKLSKACGLKVEYFLRKPIDLKIRYLHIG